MPDLRPGRKTNRQAEMSAREHATDPDKATKAKKPATQNDEMDRALLGMAEDAAGRRAFKGAKLDARAQIRTATAIAGTLIMRLDAALEQYTDACAEALKARTKVQKKDAAAKAESLRQQLGELRRTINVMAPLNAALLKAGKVVHDADLDRLIKQVTITGTSHFDAMCEGQAPP